MSHPFYTVPKRTFCCARGEESLKSCLEHYSLLYFTKKQQLTRVDFCLSCWKEEEVLKNYSSAIAFWKVKKEKREKGSFFLEKQEKTVELFKETLEKNEVEDQVKAFFLALYLVRKKRFISLKQNAEDPSFLMYEDVLTGEIFSIKTIDFHLFPDENFLKDLSLQKELDV